MFQHFKKVTQTFAIAMTCAFLIQQPAQANDQVTIVIDQGISAALPIAISDFTFNGSSQVPALAQKIIGNDLMYSGRYRPVYQQQFPQPIDKPINPSSWTSLGLNTLVTGAITQSGSNYIVNYQLIDIAGAHGVVGAVNYSNQVTFPIAEYRLGIHTISDQIFKHLTNINGVATTAIAYVTQPIIGIDNYNLVISDYDGFNPKVIHNSKRPILSPTWSPDGKKIAFVTYANEQAAIYEYNLSSGRVNKLIGGDRKDYSYYGSPSYDPSGTYISYTKSTGSTVDVYRFDNSSRQSVKLTNGGNNTEAKWHNDKIIFTSDRNGSPDVYSIGNNGENITKLTLASGRNYDGDISKIDNSLIYINNDRIVKQNLSTGSVVNITNTFLDESISLSPNGLIIIYSSQQSRGKVLNLVSVDGRFKATLPIKSGQISEPSWSPFLNR